MAELTMSAKRVRQLYAWHKWTGLMSGLFIFFLSVTAAYNLTEPLHFGDFGRASESHLSSLRLHRRVSLAHGLRHLGDETPQEPRAVARQAAAFRVAGEPNIADAAGVIARNPSIGNQTF